MYDDEVREKFLKAYGEYSDAIFRHCFFRIGDRERAKELTQETFLKSWEYLAKGNRIGNFRAFFYRVATNLIIDNSRKKKAESLEKLREEQGFDPRDEHGSEDILTFAEKKILFGLLDELSPKYREAILLRYLDDLPVKEIAELLGETENTVSVHIHRGLEKLKSLSRGKNYE